MRLVRALRHPLAPVALVAVLVPAATLVAPASQRIGWLFLDFLILGPLAAVATALAFRGALARLPVPATAPAPFPRERKLERALRWLLVLVALLGPLAMYLAALGAQDSRVAPHQVAFMCLVPLFFTVLGWQLWRDLVSARRRRAQGLEPVPFERATWTGDARLDELIGRRPRATSWLAVIIAFGSALAFLSLRQSAPGQNGPGVPVLLMQLVKSNAAIAQGEIWRTLTASFVHADLTALMVSILTLFLLGPLVEVLLGARWLVAILVLGGFAATVASFLFVAADYAGTTGAVSAYLGTLVVLAAREHRRLPPAAVRRIAVHGLTAVVILAFAGALLPNADNAAHLGGFALGVLVGLVVQPAPAVRSAMERARRESMAAVA